MGKEIFFNFKKEELLEEVRACVKETIQECLDSAPNKIDLIKSKEVCELLKISKPTLHQYMKLEILHGKYLGSRLFFSKKKILESMRNSPQIIKKTNKNGNKK